MRSRSSDTEGSALKQFPRHSKDHSFQVPEDMTQKQQDKDTTSESNAILLHPTSHSGNGHQGKDLSRDDLLFLLSILEGELQVSWFRIKPLMLQREGCLWIWCANRNMYIYGQYLSIHERKCKYTYTQSSSANLKGNWSHLKGMLYDMRMACTLWKVISSVHAAHKLRCTGTYRYQQCQLTFGLV